MECCGDVRTLTPFLCLCKGLTAVHLADAAVVPPAGLAQLVTRFGEVQDKVSGPVAVIKVGADVARTDSSGLFQFAAAINLNLAV